MFALSKKFLFVGAVVGAVLAGQAVADAQFRWPDFPSLPRIPNPIDERLRELDRQRLEAQRRAVEEARRLDAQRLEAQRRAEAEARRLDAHRRRVQREVENVRRRFGELKRNVERRQAEIEKLKKLCNGDSRELRAQAYRELRNAGAFGTNKNEVRRRLQNGLSVVVYGAEIDHVDEVQFAAAIGSSIATGNPGPVTLYLKQMLAESKATFIRNLENAPRENRDRLIAEFEPTFLRSLEQAMQGRQPVRVPVNGVSMEVGVATFNSWIDVRYQVPRLVDNGSVVGIRLYRIDTSRHHQKIPLPNTFQPYVKLQVN